MEDDCSLNQSFIVVVNQTFECVNDGLRFFHAVFLFAILAAVLAGNAAVLYLFSRHRELRHRSVLASLGLVVVDLLIATMWVFQGEASTIAGFWPFGDVGCAILTYVLVTLLYIRWCEVFVFTNDRFCKILFPFWYSRWANVLLIVSTVMAWLLPALVCLPLIALGYSAFYLSLTTCSINCGVDAGCIYGIIALFGLFIVIGALIPTGMYITVYAYGRCKTAEMKRMLQMGSGQGIPTKNKADSNVWIPSHERKALFTCFLVFITNIITNLPLFITASLRSQHLVPIWAHFLTMYIFLFGLLLDPLVIMRTRKFREVIRQEVACRRKVRIGVTAKAFYLHNRALTLGIALQDTVKPDAVGGTNSRSDGTCPSNSYKTEETELDVNVQSENSVL